MVDQLAKVLRKLTEKERRQIRLLLQHLHTGRLAGLDIKKLKGHPDIFRARKGRMRVIFRKTPKRKIKILAIERRTDTTYNKF